MNDACPLALCNARIRHPGGDRPILDNLHFSLNWNERVGLIGPNGSGKTTLLLSLVGLASLDMGELVFQGRVVRTRADMAALRRAVGLVFQNPDDQLFSPTVLEDVAFGLLNLGFSQADAVSRSIGILENLRLAHLARRQPHTLSGGQKRLVSLASVLVMQPRILLLDEPTNDLDAASQTLVTDILTRNTCPMVIASHDQELLRALATRHFRLIDPAMEHESGGSL